MRHVLVDPQVLAETAPSLTGPAFHHLARVVRVRAGEAVRLTSGRGSIRDAVVTAVGPKSVELAVTGPAVAIPAPTPVICVAQALAKGDRFEDVLQHGTECGASSFLPVIADRSVVRLPREAIPGKLERWQGIVRSATEQCGRAWIPTIETPLASRSLGDFLCKFELVLLAEVGGERLTAIASVLPDGPQSVVVLVGPEGGFGDQEVQTLVQCRAQRLSLGPYTLRTETAALAALAQITLLWGN